LFNFLVYKESGKHTFGSVEYPKGGVLRAQQNPNYQLNCLHCGRMTAFVSGTEHKVVGPAMLLVPPGTRYRARYDKGHFTWLSYAAFPKVKFTEAKKKQLAAVPLPYPMSRATEQSVKLLLAYSREADNANERAFDLQAAATLERYLYEVRGYLYPEQQVHPAVENARDYIATHLREDIGLTDIADQAHMSPEYLVRLFRSAGLPSPVSYLWQKRVEMALLLLGSTHLTLDQIGQHTGFKNPYHFSRRIKAATGLPPGEFRRTYLGHAIRRFA